MKWNDNQIKTALNGAVQDLVPELEDEIWEQNERAADISPVQTGNVCRSTRSGGKTRFVALAVLAAACLALVLLPHFRMGERVESRVYIDVNPSLELQLDQNDRVLSVLANNADGETVLADMDLRGADLDVAVNALIGSMLRQGYINETAHEVLLSVESRTPERADALRVRLTVEVEECLDTAVGKGTVYVQCVESDKELRGVAEDHAMSVGRAWLLTQITKAYPELSVDQLSEMSIHDLFGLLRSMGVDPEDFVEMYGDDIDEAEDLEDLLDDLDDDDDRDDDDNDRDDDDDRDEDHDRDDDDDRDEDDRDDDDRDEDHDRDDDDRDEDHDRDDDDDRDDDRDDD